MDEIAQMLRLGKCPLDRDFDRFLSDPSRLVSNQHWTPLVVALRVAGWLDELGVRTVVDIGSGAGKFCVATALASQCSFVGIEHRPHFVAAARDLAQRFDVADRVHFLQGTLGQCALPEADAYYLYNPFGENRFLPEQRLGDDVELSDERHRRDVAFVQSFLEKARVGTYVIGYNGFGGRMPTAYAQIRVDREMPHMLRLWMKS